MVFEENKCRVIDKKNQLMTKVEMTRNKVFPLSINYASPVALKSEISDESQLLNGRYGHLNEKGLQPLKQKDMVRGLPQINQIEGVCEGCVDGKMHHLPFPKTSWRAKAPLELVHADIFGPTRTPSLGNKRYFILFVDNYTRMEWLYFIQQKSYAFSKILEFKALVERQSGLKMKTLRTYCGGEFIYQPFLNYCKKEGIQRQLTVSRSPQQNGVAERKNRTIVEMARSMLKGKELPNSLWAEAVHTTVYILNRSPIKSVRNRTPSEAWSGRKPEVSHLKVFGCPAYSLNKAPNKDKLDQKGEKLLFVGYSDESKGYILLNPVNNKLTVAREVIFDERAVWQWNFSSQNSSNIQDFAPAKASRTESAAETQNPATSEAGNAAQGSSSESESPANEGTSSSSPILRRSERVRRPPERYGDFRSYFSNENADFALFSLSHRLLKKLQRMKNGKRPWKKN